VMSYGSLFQLKEFGSQSWRASYLRGPRLAKFSVRPGTVIIKGVKGD